MTTALPRAARVATWTYFTLNGFAVGLWVVHIPNIERATGISHSALGGLLLVLGGAAFLGMQVAGPLADRWGQRKLLPAAGVLLGIVLLVPFSVGLGALSLALAIAAKEQSWIFWTVQQTAIFPLLLLAGVLLPLDGAPAWLQAASDVNPLKYLVDAERTLFAGAFFPVSQLPGWAEPMEQRQGKRVAAAQTRAGGGGQRQARRAGGLAGRRVVRGALGRRRARGSHGATDRRRASGVRS